MLVLLGVGLLLGKPPLEFKTISIGEGLSQSSVFCIYQDRTGFLWFGTEEGLNRFDGIDFQIIYPQFNDESDQTTYPVYYVIEDNYGYLWLALYGYGLLRYDPATTTTVRYNHSPEDSNSISSDYVWTMLLDSKNNFWVGTDGAGLNRYDHNTGTFIHYSSGSGEPFQLADDYIYALLEDPAGNIWIGTSGGLECFDPDRGVIAGFKAGPSPGSLSDNSVYALEYDASGTLWIGTSGGGLNRLNLETGLITHYKNRKADPGSLSNDYVTALLKGSDNCIWIGTEDGLNRYKVPDDNFDRYYHDPAQINSIPDDGILSLAEDNSGKLWIGTIAGGVGHLSRNKKAFNYFGNTAARHDRLTSNHVYNFLEINDRELWVGTAKGLNRVYLKTGSTRQYSHDPADSTSISDDGIWYLWQNPDGNLWVGTENGISIYRSSTDNFRTLFPDPTRELYRSANTVYSIYADSESKIWIGTAQGLWQYHPLDHRFEQFIPDSQALDLFSGITVTYLLEDYLGELWIGTENEGLLCLNRERTGYRQYVSSAGTSSGFNTRDITSLFEDEDNTLWIGTFGGGLKKYMRKTDAFVDYTTSAGLANNVVYGVLADDSGHLWLSTNRGLSKFEKDSGLFHNYDIRDGLQSNEFNAGSFYRYSDGRLFFGGVAGFNYFYPDSIKDNQQVPPVVLTDFKLFNRTVAVGANSRLPVAIGAIDKLDLSYDDFVFSFVYAALNYQLPEKNQYAYRLEGFEQDWNWVGKRREATYTSIPPGEYVFQVIASNNDGVWNESGVRLPITISPPYWQTWWFRLLFLAFTVGLIYLFYKLRMRSIQRRAHELGKINRALEREITERKRAELEREEALRLARQSEKVKAIFLANISHEIRTPLNSISGYSDLLEKKFESIGDAESREFFRLIQAGNARLLNTVQSILDISQIETGDYLTNPENLDLVDLIPQLMFKLDGQAEAKAIELKFTTKLRSAPITVDRYCLTQALHNIIQNGIKYTNKGQVLVELRAEANKYAIIISDTGIGMSDDYIKHIFEPFTQESSGLQKKYQGVGVGLALAKRFIEFCQGEIEVKSTKRKGTTFTISLLTDAKTEQITAEKHMEKNLDGLGYRGIESEYINRKTVLIIADDESNRILYGHYLKEEYKVTMAASIALARQAVLSNLIDIILMDISMDKPDDSLGFARFIRQSTDWTDIPIIVITDRVCTSEKEKAMAVNFNTCLTKPISQEQLLKAVDKSV